MILAKQGVVCEECRLVGRKSTVYPGHATVTCMCVSQFYDERGRYHRHDPNIVSTAYTCTNGHRWTENERIPCQACEEDQMSPWDRIRAWFR